MPRSCDYCGACADCIRLNLRNLQRKSLIVLARAALRDEKHWTVVDVADRADNALTLATEVLTYFNKKSEECPTNCKKCKEQRNNLGESALKTGD